MVPNWMDDASIQTILYGFGWPTGIKPSFDIASVKIVLMQLPLSMMTLYTLFFWSMKVWKIVVLHQSSLSIGWTKMHLTTPILSSRSTSSKALGSVSAMYTSSSPKRFSGLSSSGSSMCRVWDGHWLEIWPNPLHLKYQVLELLPLEFSIKALLPLSFFLGGGPIGGERLVGIWL